MNKLVIGNIKMNLISLTERERYFKLFEKELANKNFSNTEIILCPPFVHLEAFEKWKNKKVHPVKSPQGGVRGAKFNGVKLGAQNMFAETKGSYTGEISPAMLKSLGCEYVILGHSERRRYLSENDHEINLKVISALKNGLIPILCVGENKGQEIITVIPEQLRDCLAGVSRVKIENVVICYEPVWAISSNNPDHLPTTNEIMSARLLIRKFLVEKFGMKIAEKVKIIYGGSVAPANVVETCINSDMDGALIGKESLTPYSFLRLAQIIDKS